MIPFGIELNYMDKEPFESKVERILKGLELAYERMVKFKKEKNSPLVISENGKVKRIPPSEIPPTARYVRPNKA